MFIQGVLPFFTPGGFFCIFLWAVFLKGENMEIIEMKVAELIPYENNPRKNENAVDKVAASMMI